MDEHEYWQWFDGQLKQPTRAVGGEPCLICGTPIESNAHWKFRDRHVCGSKCNEKLKRRWKAKVKRGDAPSYTKSDKLQDKNLNTRLRAPKLMRTLVDAPFPYEYDRFPVPGDVLERHGQHTKYVPMYELPYRGTIVETLMRDYLPDRALGVVHLESGAWTVVALQDDGTPSRHILGWIIIGDQVISALEPFELIDSLGNPVTLYCNSEIFRCLDDEGIEYSWEAKSFSAKRIAVPLWTPEYKARSEARRNSHAK